MAVGGPRRCWILALCTHWLTRSVVLTVVVLAPMVSGRSIRQAPVAAHGVDCIGSLPLEERAGQTLLALVKSPDEVTSELSAGLVAGLTPYGEVDQDEANKLRALKGGKPPLGAIVASDEEGGTVQRFASLLGPIPAARQLAATKTPAAVDDMFADYGARLRAWGVTMAFAPDADVGSAPGIGSRSFSDDPSVVTAYAAAVAHGYQRAGIVPVLKHFPGHGKASGDTHAGAATVPALSDLMDNDLVPFRNILGKGATGDAVMVGHLNVPGLTKGLPASMSADAISGLLRGQLGFDGLVISDALGMGAIVDRFSTNDAVVRFLIAGGDLAIVPAADAADARAAVTRAVVDGKLPEARLNEAVGRVLATKNVDACAGTGGTGTSSDGPTSTSTGSVPAPPSSGLTPDTTAPGEKPSDHPFELSDAVATLLVVAAVLALTVAAILFVQRSNSKLLRRRPPRSTQ